MLSTIQTVFLCAGSFITSSLVCPPNPTVLQDDGVIIILPPRSNDTGLKKVPDAAHPYMPPGPTDQRGPCPALNTLANHGYLPRSGIVTIQNIMDATREGFNMDHDLSAFLAGFALLARGNAKYNLLSIGGVDKRVPSLPAQVDGDCPPGGIAKHGRFEGDVSMTRQDAALGDDRNFQDSLFDQFLTFIGQYGDNSTVTGPHSLVNLRVMQEFKYQRFIDDQKRNPALSFHASRVASSYNEAAFILKFFANGTDETLSVPSLGSIFRNQTFTPNWWRRASPGNLSLITSTASMINSVNTLFYIPPGENKGGKYMPDPPFYGCDPAYYDFVTNNLPYTYAMIANGTDIFAQNVRTLLKAIATPFKCPEVPPNGPKDPSNNCGSSLTNRI
ncbi:Cloroperoxidase [Sistotremastrum suecicum HHB10207 ss-3]|uniref:Cloroperoxidase n=1 Tax=Sistotremastrum suecicum HHB10207 ss-3 TaxID=1314776 RepID=A0A165YV90_9AGAM|nr:Cloroperoxidase [Sistotremastrum suecicum HHB10207 ss-3]